MTVLIAGGSVAESDGWICLLTFADLQIPDIGLRQVDARADAVFLFVRFQIDDACFIFVLEDPGDFVHLYPCLGCGGEGDVGNDVLCVQRVGIGGRRYIWPPVGSMSKASCPAMSWWT